MLTKRSWIHGFATTQMILAIGSVLTLAWFGVEQWRALIHVDARGYPLEAWNAVYRECPRCEHRIHDLDARNCPRCNESLSGMESR